MSIKCIVIEDEPAAREILQRNLAQCPELEWCGSFADPFSAQPFLDKNTVDLMFLDINLPGMSGVSFLRTLIKPPLVIITTAYPQYAVDGFDLEVVDFLLKPFSFERFYKSVNKAKERLVPKSVNGLSRKITVKADKRIYQIDLDELLYVEACGDYTTVCCTDKKLITHETLKNWEEKLKGHSFQKIHRSIIINLQKIDHIEGNMAIIGKHKLVVSEAYREQLITSLLGRNLTHIG
ncbi:MAG: LytTR family DNA-binding domain-containing protein [Bacteroidia bacterium]|nr:LytTR family DNA-binding domain-containing protein [Bacteroidia bacterium]